jgi:hypothetical protein
VTPVADRSDRVSRGPGERALAWLFTGPLGHLYSTLVDLVVESARYWRERARS